MDPPESPFEVLVPQGASGAPSLFTALGNTPGEEEVDEITEGFGGMTVGSAAGPAITGPIPSSF